MLPEWQIDLWNTFGIIRAKGPLESQFSLRPNPENTTHFPVEAGNLFFLSEFVFRFKIAVISLQILALTLDW